MTLRETKPRPSPLLLPLTLLLLPLAAAQPDALDLPKALKEADGQIEATADDALDASSLENGSVEPFETVQVGWYSWYVHRAYSVVDNADEWGLLWAHHHGWMHGFSEEDWVELPEVDFGREMLLVVFMGSSFCGGDSQRVVSVQTRPDPTFGNVTTVWMDTKRAFVLDSVLYADTNPHHIVRVPRSDGLVVFASRHVIGDAVDAAASGATVGAIFNCKPTQSPLVYRAADPGTVVVTDTVPAPVSTLPFLGSSLAEGM